MRKARGRNKGQQRRSTFTAPTFSVSSSTLLSGCGVGVGFAAGGVQGAPGTKACRAVEKDQRVSMRKTANALANNPALTGAEKLGTKAGAVGFSFVVLSALGAPRDGGHVSQTGNGGDSKAHDTPGPPSS